MVRATTCDDGSCGHDWSVDLEHGRRRAGTRISRGRKNDASLRSCQGADPAARRGMDAATMIGACWASTAYGEAVDDWGLPAMSMLRRATGPDDTCADGDGPDAGEVAPPFRDCRQEAIDSGNCGTGDWDTCAVCGSQRGGTSRTSATRRAPTGWSTP